ncbi:MAG: YhcH/YjgK/YiaL family protein [Elusimicrobia bacterium HGW-Elusimicrobia-3]|nr:MAG: YhcH/YjgK/YiaL family protein [Elusimicrobia bacterium HGW-Elusimicrobia-3]
MIAVPLTLADRQAPALPGLALALAWLRRPEAAGLPDGRYEIDGERVFALVQRYETLAGEPRFEAHRRYADVQYLAAGAETIAAAPLAALAVTEAYDAGKDVCFGAVPAGRASLLVLAAGELAILYPEDAHAPRLAAGAPAPVTKIVVKVEIK